MKYIITSGPMETKIDDVRKIENSSTGSLGVQFIDSLVAKNYEQIVYIHTENAKLPSHEIKTIEVNSHAEIISALEAEITDDSVIIHAMAISDFNYQGTISVEELAQKIIENKNKLNNEGDVLNLLQKATKTPTKLSSKENQLLVMNRATKVIDEIKKINSKCRLVGFKLLSNVDYEELVDVASSIKERASCEYVVANRKEDICDGKHVAIIVGDNEKIQVKSKAEIAEKIIELMEG